MTEELFRADAYLDSCEASVVDVGEEGIVLDRTVFYPLGGGQPGDTGTLRWEGGEVRIVDTRYGSDGRIRHVPAPGSGTPAAGTPVTGALDWARRYRHMRMHTAMHLLGSVLNYGVTGGNITTEKSRLDFDMEDTINKDAVGESLAQLVAADHAVRCRWISEAELDASPELVRTMSVAPPRGRGSVRLLEIEGIDLQPCGGTHVRSTAEVGRVRIGKVEKKGRHNRRVNIHLDD